MKEKTWKKIALENHIFLSKIEKAMLKEYDDKPMFKKIIIAIRNNRMENIPIIKKLNEIEEKGK